MSTHATTVNPNLDAALAYAARGWCIYPSFPGTKSKTNLKWRTESTTNQKQVRYWWTKWLNATICLDCEKSGLAVLDLDQKDGKDGRTMLDLLEFINEPLPPTLAQRTPSGGTHLIFIGTIKTTVGANGLGEGIDTRGKGGMIVLAPTKLGTGQYEWLNDLEPADLPQWVADLAGTVPERGETPDGEYTPTYAQEEFAELINLIPVEKYDGNHDAWLELMLACTHASTVEDGKEAFMDWTTGHGEGNYAGDYDMIAARWDYNFANRNMPGRSVQVGTFNKHLADAGHGDKVRNAWDSTAEEDFGGENALPSSEAKTEETERKKPRIVIAAGDLPRITRKVKRFLMTDASRDDCPASDKVFRRGGVLVHLNRNHLDPGETVDKDYHVEDDLNVQSADLDWLSDRAERCIDFLRINKNDDAVPCDVPVKLVRRVQSIITSWDFPPLLGTVETPTLRSDGSLLDVPGYDRRSGLYYDPGRVVFPKIDPKPSRQQAKDSLAKLRAILADFPFNDSDDDQQGLSEAVALAILLTAVVRRSLPTAPMFGIDAFEAQSGKTLLAQLAAIMATGRKTAERPWSASEEERRKALGAALEAGDAVVLYRQRGHAVGGRGICRRNYRELVQGSSAR